MNGVYWCCEFAWWCHYTAFGSDYLKDGTIKTASCEEMRKHFVKIDRYSKTPKKGDFIFFQTTTKGVANHIGIVVKVSGDTVYTIEGNTSNAAGVERNGGCVAKKSYNKGYDKILGYGHPKYDVKKLTAPKPPLKYGMEGAAVKKLQKCLNKVMGTKIPTDGVFGETTAKTLRGFKVKINNKNLDGKYYGKAVYKALKKKLK